MGFFFGGLHNAVLKAMSSSSLGSLPASIIIPTFSSAVLTIWNDFSCGLISFFDSTDFCFRDWMIALISSTFACSLILFVRDLFDISSCGK